MYLVYSQNSETRVLDSKVIDDVFKTQLIELINDVHRGWSFTSIALGTNKTLLFICAEPAYRDERVFVGYMQGQLLSQSDIKARLKDTQDSGWLWMQARVEYVLEDANMANQTDWDDWFIDFSNADEETWKSNPEKDISIRYTVTKEVALEVALYVYENDDIPATMKWIENKH